MTCHNRYVIKSYGEGYYKLSVVPIRKGKDPDRCPVSYDGKLHNSLSRARNKIFEYALCNNFTHFCTLTLNPDKYNRQDLKTYIKDLSQFIRDERKRKGDDIQYLLIPERHMDGVSWHMHGLLKLPDNVELELFQDVPGVPLRLRRMLRAGRKVYNWPGYSKRFGWVTVEPVQNKLAVSKYITKYATKEIYNYGVTEKNAKVYYNSRGLKQATRYAEGKITDSVMSLLDFDYITKIKNDTADVELFLCGTKELNEETLHQYLNLLKRGNYNEN